MGMRSGEVVGFAMVERMTKNLVSRSLLRDIAAKRPPAGLIHHSPATFERWFYEKRLAA
jgi:transposase InsO family protein